MNKLTCKDFNIGDIFTATNEYGGKCKYKIIKEIDSKIELINITLFNEPLYVTEEWFKTRDITKETI